MDLREKLAPPVPVPRSVRLRVGLAIFPPETDQQIIPNGGSDQDRDLEDECHAAAQGSWVVFLERFLMKKDFPLGCFLETAQAFE
jgi:hypothetical protein